MALGALGRLNQVRGELESVRQLLDGTLAARDDEIRHAYHREGLTVGEIARALQCSPSLVVKVLGPVRAKRFRRTPAQVAAERASTDNG